MGLIAWGVLCLLGGGGGALAARRLVPVVERLPSRRRESAITDEPEGDP